MNLKQTLEEIDRILERTPYTKEEIATIWEAEKEEWDYETVIALAAAYEFVHNKGDEEKAKFLRGKYEKALSDFSKEYGY